MNYTKTVFLKLVANCICEDRKIEEIDFSKLDNDELINLSRVNTVSAIVYSALKEFDEVPGDLLSELKREFELTVLKMSKYDSVLEIVANKLKESNITYILVKGKTIAKYYPSIELRDMGDIDILVSPNDFERAKNLFEDFCILKPGQVDNKYEISYMLNGVTIELQNSVAYDKNLSGKVDYEKYFGDLINHKVLDGNLSIVEPTHGFIYNIYHMAQHFYYTGCGVRMIIDLAVLIKQFKDDFDWERIIKTLDVLELLEFANNVFSIIDDWFGIRIPIIYDKQEVSDECLEYFINAGVFGRANINSDIGNVQKQESFFKWAFPSYSYMRENNDWFKNKPAILLPLAYIIRIIKGLRERGGMVKGVSVAGKTKRDLKRHKEIVKMMGLE